MAGLREAGLVRAEKGRGRGWSVNRDLSAITVRDVHAALGEPSVFSVGLRNRLPECRVERAVNAALGCAFGEAEALLMDRLCAVTLARLAEDLRVRVLPTGAPTMSTLPAQAFDATHAEAYDRNLERLLPIKDTLHLLIRWQFSGLPDAARILVAGAGTGAEARFLAPLFPRWRFTLVDPSEAMLAVGRRHAVAEGFVDRCEFHVGLVSSLAADSFDAATSVLVSQFLTDAADRRAYFAEIARRLKPGGLLFNADLCADTGDPSFGSVMDLWLTLAGMPDERRDSFRAAFGSGLAAHGPAEVEAMIAGAGFSAPAQCFQATLIRGWVAALPSVARS
jgi:tRNA (cmo5U34)-methyltransferase